MKKPQKNLENSSNDWQTLSKEEKDRLRKAKEKDLLREFTTRPLSIEEERRSRLKTLIKMGKAVEKLTHQDIKNIMGEEVTDSSKLETLIGLLKDIGVNVED